MTTAKTAALVTPHGGQPACPICMATGFPCFIAGAYRMYRCVGCGTAFVDPMPTNQALMEFYSDYHKGGVDDGNYAEEAKMRSHHATQLQRIRQAFAGDPQRLLDIGCGKGFFMEACAAEGINCKGVEVSDEGARYASEVLGLDVECGDLCQLKHQLGKFDAATLWGVIEHLPRPVDVLRDAMEVLEPGGLVFVTTGIGYDWLDRLLPGVNQWYDPPQHLFVFSARGMQICLERAGFEVVAIERNYDRTTTRRMVRFARNALTGVLLRIAAETGRLRAGAWEMTRFPLANYMFAVARRPTDCSAKS